jgi:DNA (cytosine-5)-methyltransferase 1
MKVLSLFTGAGGLDIGLEAAGFEIAGCVENEEDALDTLRLNRPSWPQAKLGNIHSYDPAELLGELGLRRRDIAILSAGPPCQPFSKSGWWASGGSKRMEDPRANTLKALLDVAEAAEPEVILIENVAGLTYAGKDEGLTAVKEGLERVNRVRHTHYALNILNIRAEFYGVPQKRHRVFLIAAREGTTFVTPPQTHGVASGDERLRTAWDAIGHLADAYENSEDLRLRGLWADLVPSIPEGSNYLWHTPRGGGLPLFGWRTKYWTFLLKLAKSLPAWTIQAQSGPATGPFHWNNRLLSVEELCRLQTFPEHYRIHGSDSSARRQVGNAVPAAIGELIGLVLKKRVFGQDGNRPPSLIPALRDGCPSPERRGRVPSKYFVQKGAHPAHPGTGLGPRALKRDSEAQLDR